MTSSPIAIGGARSASARFAPALAALFFGIFLFLGTGFAAPDLIHNATHDTRHAFGLPCH